MGINTYGFIATENKDVWRTCDAVRNVLKELKTTKGNGVFRNKEISSEIIAEYEIHSSKFITVSFWDGDDPRRLFIYFDCDCDFSEAYRGSKIIFSLNCWGRSSFLIKSILKHFDEPKWFVENDCCDEWVRLD